MWSLCVIFATLFIGVLLGAWWAWWDNHDYIAQLERIAEGRGIALADLQQQLAKAEHDAGCRRAMMDAPGPEQPAPDADP